MKKQSTMYAVKYAPTFSLHDTLSIMCFISWRWAEGDRFGILEGPYNFVPDPNLPLPQKVYDTLPMRELALNRAASLLERARKENRKLAILWSGGVDSTSIIAAFRLAGASTSDLIILHTNDSIQEYLRGYLKMKNEDGFLMKCYSWEDSLSAYESLGDSVIFVTGWCADQLFGSIVNGNFPELYDTLWKDGMRKVIRGTIDRVNNSESYARVFRFLMRNPLSVKDSEIDMFLDEFDAYAKKIGIELKYTCDATWLANFGIKWSHVSRDLQLTMENDEQRKNVVNFYDDISFQEWAMVNYRKYHLHNQVLDTENYKRVLKEIVFEYFKDETFLKMKGKQNSWSSVVPGSILRYAPMRIWDTEKGFLSIDIRQQNKETLFERQEMNTRKALLPYLKKSVDRERFLSGEVW